jgi:hypothetical protein
MRINHHVSRSHAGALASVVYLAQAVSRDVGSRDHDRERHDVVDPVPMIALGIDPDRYGDLLIATHHKFALLSSRFG